MQIIILKYSPEPGFGEFHSFDNLTSAIDFIQKKRPLTDFIRNGKKINKAGLEPLLLTPGNTVSLNHGDDFWIFIATSYQHF